MDFAVVYASKTGYSQRYAQWAAESLGCSAVPFSEIEALRVMRAAKTVIFCAGMYLTGINEAARMREFMQLHPDKRYVVVYVGATPMPRVYGSREASEAMFYHCFPKEKFPGLAWCYCQGGYHAQGQGVFSRAMIALYAAMLPLRLKREPDRPFLQMQRDLREGFDGCDRSYLDRMIAYVLSEEEAPKGQNLTVE